LRKKIAAMKAEAVIPSNRSRKNVIPHDPEAYRNRNRIERCFNRLKHLLRFATRYDRRSRHFEGFAYLAKYRRLAPMDVASSWSLVG